MIKKLLTLFLALVFTATLVKAQELKINQLNFATSVENRTPSGVDTSFTASVGDIICFTHVVNIPDTTQITHVWYYKDEEKARINLQVQANEWRTWSSKSILKSWTGPWRVIVEDDNGKVLASKTFVIEE